MNVTITKFILLLLFTTSKSDKSNYCLIKDYLQWNNMKTALFLSCGSLYWRELNPITENSDIRLNFWDITETKNVSNFNYQHFFARTTYPFCVIVSNWDCNQTQSILNEISNRALFHYERYWLIIGGSVEEMYNSLKEENINIDAEVAIVVPIGEK